MHRPLIALIAGLTLLITTGCTGVKLHKDYTDDYLKALVEIPGETARDRAAIANFILAMSDLKHPDARIRLENAYAETLYFNDTVHTFRTRDDVIAYMLKTADGVESIIVDIDDVAVKDNDYYLRWVMTMRFTVSGKTVDSKSIGMTHVRTDESGRVVIHQDYWDGVEGLYQHIPIVGYFIGKVQTRM